MEKNPLPNVPVAAGGSVERVLAGLASAMRTESRLLGDLLSIMERQRDAVACDDVQTVEECVFATHRVLHTISEAQRRRRSINRLLGAADDLPIRDLESLLAVPIPDELRAARDEVEALARKLTIVVDVNRMVLRGALSKGDDYVRALGRAPANQLYSADPRQREPARPGGILMDQVI